MKKIVFNGVLILGLSLSLILSSCASTSGNVHQNAAVNNLYSSGKYDKGLETIKLDKKIYGQEDVLYGLDAGVLSHFAGDYEESADFFLGAEKLMADRAEGKEELTSAYNGEDYEDVFLNILNSLNYFYLGNNEDAVTELSCAGDKLKKYGNKYKIDERFNAEIAGSDDAARTQVLTTLLGVKSDFEKEIYSRNLIPAKVAVSDTSLLCEYLAMIYERAALNTAKAQEHYNLIKNNSLTPATAKDEISVQKGKARLNVVAFIGQMGSVAEKSVYAATPVYGLTEYTDETRLKNHPSENVPGENYILHNVVYPVVEDKTSQVARCEVYISQTSYPLQVIEDFNAEAQLILNAKARSYYYKSFVEGYMENILISMRNEEVIAAEVEKSVAAKTPEYAINLTRNTLRKNEASELETADKSRCVDTRCASYFPGKAAVTGVNVDPGVYNVSVVFYDENNKIVKQFDYNDYEIKEGEVNLVEVYCNK